MEELLKKLEKAEFELDYLQEIDRQVSFLAGTKDSPGWRYLQKLEEQLTEVTYQVSTLKFRIAKMKEPGN